MQCYHGRAAATSMSLLKKRGACHSSSRVIVAAAASVSPLPLSLFSLLLCKQIVTPITTKVAPVMVSTGRCRGSPKTHRLVTTEKTSAKPLQIGTAKEMLAFTKVI